MIKEGEQCLEVEEKASSLLPSGGIVFRWEHLKSTTVKGTDESRCLVIMVEACGSSLLLVSIFSGNTVISCELGFKRKY